MTDRFVFYDFETTGTHPAMDRPVQFAASIASADFTPIEDVEFKAKLAGDVIPSPMAQRVHGLTPSQLKRDGLKETEFAGRVADVLAAPNQIIMGYNNAGFDDPFTQHLFWRNFIDPYRWHWADGNLRYDLLTVVRAVHVFAHNALNWPERDGLLSMKLEDLAPANGIDVLNAHDALSDTRTTRDLAAHIASQAPDVWAYCLSLAHKQPVKNLVDEAQNGHGALVHLSPFYGRSNAYCGLVYPIGYHPNNPNELWAVDLSKPLEPLFEHSADELKRLRFERDVPVALTRIAINKAPGLFPLDWLARPGALDVSGIDREVFRARRAQARQKTLLEWRGLAETVLVSEYPTSPFVDAQLYDGLIHANDAKRAQQVRRMGPTELTTEPPTFDDDRLNALLPLFIARNYPEALTPKAYRDWTRFRTQRWLADGPGVTLASYQADMQTLASEGVSEEDQAALFDLESWVQELAPPL